MKIIIYYMLLLVFIALLAGFLLFGNSGDMSMPELVSICGALVLYTVGLSLAGEGNNLDERDRTHRNLANRAGLIAGTLIFSLGLIYQMAFHHKLDWWLLMGLIGINLTKVFSLIYLNYRR